MVHLGPHPRRNAGSPERFVPDVMGSDSAKYRYNVPRLTPSTLGCPCRCAFRLHLSGGGNVLVVGDLARPLRRPARERRGPLPSINVADALLDERRELT